MKTSQLQLLVKPLDELLTVRLALAEAETRIKDAKCDKTRNPSYVDIGLTTSAAELELMLGRTGCSHSICPTRAIRRSAFQRLIFAMGL